MSHFAFEHPYALVLLLLIVCIYKCPVSAREIRFPHTHFFGNVTTFLNKEKLLFSIILASMIVALASPITYDQKEQNKRKGRDLVFALDTSGSMSESGYDEEHRQEEKFAVLKELLRDFIKHRFDDNMGVSIFGTFAYPAVPLTYDVKSVSFLLDFFNVSIAGENTAIGEGLWSALKILEKGHAKNRVIVLITDGYQNSGAISVKQAVQKAKKMGVKIYTIGIGKKSDFDANLLERIAKESGGKMFAAQNAKELEAVYEELDALEPSNIRSANYLNKHLLFPPFLWFALALLLLVLRRFERREIA